MEDLTRRLAEIEAASQNQDIPDDEGPDRPGRPRRGGPRVAFAPLRVVGGLRVGYRSALFQRPPTTHIIQFPDTQAKAGAFFP